MQHLRRRRVLSSVLLLIALAVVAARIAQAADASVSADDLDVYRGAALAARSGAASAWVPGFVYLPAALVAFAPLAWVSAAVATEALLLLSAAVVTAGAWRLARIVDVPPLAAVALVFLVFPTESALQFGNVTAIQFGLLVAAVEAARAKRPVVLGLLLGVGIVLKPLLLACLLVPVVRRRYATLVPAVMLPAAVSGAVLLVVGDAAGWLRTVRAGLRTAAADPASADLGSTLDRLHLGAVASGLVVVLVVALAGPALRSAVRADADPARMLLVPLPVVMLLGGVAWAHYPMLVLPLLAERFRAGGAVRGLAIAAGVCFALPEVLHGGLLTAVPPGRLFLVLTVGLVLLLAASVPGGWRLRTPAQDVRISAAPPAG